MPATTMPATMLTALFLTLLACGDKDGDTGTPGDGGAEDGGSGDGGADGGAGDGGADGGSGDGGSGDGGADGGSGDGGADGGSGDGGTDGGSGDGGTDGGSGDGGASSGGTITIADLVDEAGVLSEKETLTAAIYGYHEDPIDIWILDPTTATLELAGPSVLDTLTLGTSSAIEGDVCSDLQAGLDLSAALVAGLPADNDVADICDRVDDWFAGLEARWESTGPRLTLGATVEDLFFELPRTGSWLGAGGLTWRSDWWRYFDLWDADSCAFVDAHLGTSYRYELDDVDVELDVSTGSGTVQGTLWSRDVVASGDLTAVFDYELCVYEGDSIVILDY